MNIVYLEGFVGGEPVLRVLEGNTNKVASFSIATSKSYKDKKGDWQSITTWHDITAWNKIADKAMLVKKGEKVFVVGEIKHEEYTNADGVKIKRTKIVAEKISLIFDRKPDDQPKQTEPTTEPEPEFPDDDLPF